MCRVLNSILAVTAVAGLGGAAPESRSPSIEGVWRAVEVRTTGPGAPTFRSPFTCSASRKFGATTTFSSESGRSVDGICRPAATSLGPVRCRGR